MILDPILDVFRGKAVTIPPMDGAFRPNTALEDAPVFARLAEADNLAPWKGAVIASSGNALYRLTEGAPPELLEVFEAPVSAIATSSAGEIAVALDDGRLFIDREEVPTGSAIRCITALAFAADGGLWLANGSAEHRASDWAADLMRKRASGSIWRRAAGQAAFEQRASGLAFPNGLLPVAGGVVFSESWRHRLMRLDGNGLRPVLEQIPGYPARLAPLAEGAILAVFAPRNRLIELVLQEDHYRHDMIAEVPRPYWIAPALASGKSFLEPLQCGGIRTMGVHKPWAPSRSWGLVVRLDAAMQPVESWHSRANGTRHGVCSAIAWEGRILAASKGGDLVAAMEAG
ncbi:hypothetical protein D2T29_16845 [Sinirhodobacter populi]|uniref:Strictosidine synthase n=1 Tax=Paenirhodobacter populi TaxID=2306993 RepID=A0A443K6A5_9RHOB|nr:hypothetical protein [Sinirhodobacter populi]RWR28307.1 hypothetical protein D2T29_16845 [Sinirhodobacter populi]